MTIVQVSRGMAWRVYVDDDGRLFELASFRGGPIEVYEVREGLASFRGYLDALAGPVRAGLLAAWLSAFGPGPVVVADTLGTAVGA
jgi:hypothetical protein